MFQRFFPGRYGLDPLSMLLFCLALPFFGSRYLWIVGLLIVAYGLFRVFSRNLDKRRREAWAFNDIMRKIAFGLASLTGRIRQSFRKQSAKFAARRQRWQQRKIFVFVRCPACKGILRLPRGKGRLMVTCPVCRHEFQKKT